MNMKSLLVLSGLMLAAGLVCAEPSLKVDWDSLPFKGKSGFVAKGSEKLVSPTQGFTVSAWVYPQDGGRDQMFVDMGAANEDFSFYLYRGQVRMLVADGGKDRYSYATATAPESKKWTHFLGSYDGQTIRIWRNGVLAGEKKAPCKRGAFTHPVSVGRLPDSEERALVGALAGVRIWNRALTTEDVAAAYAGTDPAGLVAAWEPGKGDRAKNAVKGGPDLERVKVSLECRALNTKADGFKGIWYMNQPSHDEYVYKYSGGMGVYCAGHVPMAVYAKEVDKTFFCYGGTDEANSTLLHCVSYYDHKTKLLARPTVVLDKQTTDAHDNPVIGLDDKGHIFIFSSSHGRGRPSYISKSVRPYDISEFRIVWTGNFSYPQPFYVPGQGFLFVHAWYVAGRSNCFMTSDPAGETWTDRTRLAYFNAGHYQRAWPFGDRKVGIAFDQHPAGKGLNWRTDVFYMESDDYGKTWKNIQGETLALPLDKRENPALVVGYADKSRNVYIKGVKFNSKGYPIITYIVSKGYESGPKNNPREWKIAKWTGSEWVERNTGITSDNNYDFSTLYVDTDTDWRLIGASGTGPQPFNPGGEIGVWATHDAGDTWTFEKALTAKSVRNQNYPRQPLNVHPGFYALWADGHGRKPSESSLYFCDRDLNVYRMPRWFEGDFAQPEPYTPGMADPKRPPAKPLGHTSDAWDLPTVTSNAARVADWSIAHPRRHNAIDWTYGAYYAGLVEFGLANPDLPYADMARKAGGQHAWNLAKRKFHADDHTIGQTWLELARADKAPDRIVPTRARFDEILATRSTPPLVTRNAQGKLKQNWDRWCWCDALFMAPPVWAKLANLTGEKKYRDFMVEEYKATHAALFDKESHLFYRDSSYIGKKTRNGRKIFWSRGNGWVLGGLPLVIRELKADDPDRVWFVSLFKEMCAKIKSIQRDDGSWSPSLDDGADPDLQEMSGTSFFCYAMMWGINNGILSETEYLPTVKRAWSAMCRNVADDGKFGWVQQIGAAPVRNIGPDSTEVYGVGAYLLSAAEIQRYLKR